MIRNVLELAAANKAIQRVAQQENKSFSEVYTAIQEAICTAFHTPNPAVQAKWAQIPRKGEIPTPEELLAWMRNNLY